MSEVERGETRPLDEVLAEIDAEELAAQQRWLDARRDVLRLGGHFAGHGVEYQQRLVADVLAYLDSVRPAASAVVADAPVPVDEYAPAVVDEEAA